MHVDKVIDACLNLSHDQKEGCLFVVESEKPAFRYYKDFNADIFRKNNRRLSVFEDKDKQLIRQLAAVDGATIINHKGELIHYGATLVNAEKVIGHGKRHAFAMGTSKKVKGAVCILASEEDHHVRAFTAGVCIADIDGETRLNVSTRQKVAEILGAPITKTLVSAGIATSILASLNPALAILTISGSYVMVSEGFNKLKFLIK
jgi:hypothetical protein